MTKSWGVLDPLSRSLKTEEANLFQEPLPGPRSGGSRKMPCKLPNFGVICDTYFPLLLAAAPLKRPFRVVARGWCGVTQTLYTSLDVELRGRVHVVSTTVRVA